jgi:hypothetical protein
MTPLLVVVKNNIWMHYRQTITFSKIDCYY